MAWELSEDEMAQIIGQAGVAETVRGILAGSQEAGNPIPLTALPLIWSALAVRVATVAREHGAPADEANSLGDAALKAADRTFWGQA